MLTSNQTLDMTPIGGVFRVVKTPQETNGQSLEMEWETYKVLEGQLELNINGKWKLLQKDEEITVTEGVPHTFRNPTSSVTKVYNIHSPAMCFDAYFEGLNNIVAKLSHGGKEKIKMNITTAIHLSMLMKKYKEEIVSVNPPNLVVSLLNSIGKIRGIKI
jgi:hypothetical protein